MKLRALPVETQALCEQLNAPARLVLHLQLVHDSAIRICRGLDKRLPGLAYDRNLVLLGAALHDVGKIEHPEELSGPGNTHEVAGEKLLLREGWPTVVARIARTHGQWRGEAQVCLEDLLVALADKAWRGGRDKQLDIAVVKILCRQKSLNDWKAFSILDRILRSVAAKGQCAPTGDEDFFISHETPAETASINRP